MMMGRVLNPPLTSLNFHVYAWPFKHCLYFIYAREFYVRTHGKITRQWKSTLRQLSFDPLFGLYASQGSLLFGDYSFPEGSFGFLERDYSLPEGGITPDKVLRSAHGKDLQLH